MTLITAFGSGVFKNDEHVKLSSSSNLLSELVLRDLSFKSVVQLLIQYDITFDSRYDVLLLEACTANFASELVSLPFLQDAVS